MIDVMRRAGNTGLVGVIAGCALAGVGCGAGASASPPTTVRVAHTVTTVETPQEYSARVNAICRKYHARQPTVAGKSLTAVALTASEDAPVFKSFEQAEAAVPIPPREASLVHSLRAALQVKYEETKAIPGIVARKGLDGLIGIEAKDSQVAGEVVALDHQLGLDECARS